MQIDPDDFRQHYRELNDDALLSIDRDELSDVARQAYDDEVQTRGLRARAPIFEVPEMDEELVTVASFMFPDEAKLARGLVQSPSIRCYLANEHTLSIVWTWTIVLGGLRLMVPISQVEEVRQILETVVPDDELESLATSTELSDPNIKSDSARPVTNKGRGPKWLLLSMLLFFGAPDPAYLYIFRVFR